MIITLENAMKHILIDFENVQPEPADLNSLCSEDCHIWLFLGKLQQKNLSVELCEALCRFGQNVHFIRIAKIGKNALDFYLTYYLGKITTEDKNAVIYILSRDNGFDVLVEHLQENNYCNDIIRITHLTKQQDLDLGIENARLDIENNIPKYQDEKFIGTCRFKVGKILRESPTLRFNLYNSLISVITQTILKEELNEFDETIQRDIAVVIIGQLIEKKIITMKQTTGEIEYYFLNVRQLIESITQQVKISKPKTLTALHNVIRSKSLGHYFELKNDEIMQIIDALKQQEILKQSGNKILYSPFNEVELIVSTEQEPLVMQKAMQCFTKWRVKPKSVSALTNALKSHLKLEPKHISLIIQRLVNQDKISIQEGNKISYKF